MDKLKPCPFCGSDKLKIESSSSKYRDRPTDIGGWVLYRHYIMSVRCNVCYARGCTVSGDVVIDTRYGDLVLAGYTTVEKIKEETIEAWNRRVNDASVRHGRWEGIDSSYWKNTPYGPIVVEKITYRCNICNRRTPIKSGYCPKCGALMDGGKDNG